MSLRSYCERIVRVVEGDNGKKYAHGESVVQGWKYEPREPVYNCEHIGYDSIRLLSLTHVLEVIF